MIVFDEVSKSYPLKGGKRLHILSDFSAVMPKQHNFGILGANGAGKSTLMRLIAGSEMPSRGRVLREGRISWPLGFNGGFNPTLSGSENLNFVARLYEEDYDEIFDFVADFSELGRFLDEPFGTYSSGMRARLAFGLSMAIDFDYYLIDEIIAVGDARFKKKCQEVLNARRRKATVVLVSHSSRLLEEFCDIGGVLANGSLVFYDTLAEAIEVHAENQKQAFAR